MKKAVIICLIGCLIVACSKNGAHETQPIDSAVKDSAPGWYYAKWGMTTDEVILASAGKAKVLTQQQRESQSTGLEDALVGAPFTSGQFNFETRFLFDKLSHKLSSVNLGLKNPALKMELIYALNEKYGKPVRHDPGDIYGVRWWAPQLDINYLAIGNTVSVTYRPRKEATGL